ncbi:MAG TPA: hypothetical protein VK846_02725 [Candidatus Limnocylindria bacterium]|nr:hypothetical protein [Candidatus Limnocylindria bacterium]
MIHLRDDCLVFEMSNGDKIPCSASSVTVELMGSAVDFLDRDVVEHAAAAVLHYFQNELHRTEVTLNEFTEALEKALRGLGLNVTCDAPKKVGPRVQADLRRLAAESGKAFELGFFARLREELRKELQLSPELIRFFGLRSCVKQLAGAQRWCPRCEQLSDHIVEFLRGCIIRENPPQPCGLLVV